VEEEEIINRCRNDQTYEYRLGHGTLPGTGFRSRPLSAESDILHWSDRSGNASCRIVFRLSYFSLVSSKAL
jgi:hypothetical protein